MSSAEHAHSITRRTVLARISSTPVIAVTGAAAIAAPINRTELATIVLQWHEAVAVWKAELRIDEKSEAAAARYEVWSDLEHQIFSIPAQSADDLRLKMDFYRRETAFNDDWLSNIFDDVERLLVKGAVA